MADLKAFAEQLVNLTVKEVNELATILKEEYGIEPAAAAVAVAAGPAGSPVVRHCTAGKKGRQRKGAGEGKCSGDAGRANGIHTDSDRRQYGRICGIS